MNTEKVCDRFLSLFFPKRCGFCGKVIEPQYEMCESCESLPFEIKGEICPFCGTGKEYCTCKKKRNSFDGVVAPFYYEDGAKSAIWRLKFDGREEIASFLALYLRKSIDEKYSEIVFDEITFVPISKSQKKDKPYNHSELLANELSKTMNIPVRDYIVKLFDTPSQHSLKESKRKGNVFGVFDVKNATEKPTFSTRAVGEFSPEGKTILLCDDVKTTGSTLDECAKMLKLNGAKAVYCVTAAITKKTFSVDKEK